MTFGFFIQGAYANWSGGLDDCVKKKDNELLVELTLRRLKAVIKSHQLPGRVILVIPEQEDAIRFYNTLAKQYEVDVFAGDSENVLQRLLDVCEAYGIDQFARINGSYWYLKEVLFSDMTAQMLEKNCDLLRVPVSYPKGLAAEFSRVSALKRLDDINRAGGGGPISSPFAAMEKYPDAFDVCENTSVPRLTLVEVEEIRQGRRQYEPEQVEFDPEKMSAVGSVDFQRYKKALEYLDAQSMVLDIACGSGYGSYMLSQQCASVIGGDYNPEIVEKCSQAYHNDNLRFELADVTRLPYQDESFDVVVSMETIEHVDEKAYISEVARVLKPKGKLILSTPQNEWGFTLVPWHLKEYGLQEFKDCLSIHFHVVKVHGINSHVISDTSEVGDRMLLIAEKV